MGLGRSYSSWICLNLPVYGGNWDPLDVALQGGEPPVPLLSPQDLLPPPFLWRGRRGYTTVKLQFSRLVVVFLG